MQDDEGDKIDPQSIIRLLGTAGLSVLVELISVEQEPEDEPLLKILRKMSLLVVASLVAKEDEEETAARDLFVSFYNQPFSS